MPSIRRIDLPAMRAALARRAAEVATAILGNPNLQLSSARELRFGKRGSTSVVVAGRKAGCWFDHENGVGGESQRQMALDPTIKCREAAWLIVGMIQTCLF